MIRKLDRSQVCCENTTYHTGGSARKNKNKHEKNDKTRLDDSGECHREASNADAHSGGCGNDTPSNISSGWRGVYSRYARSRSEERRVGKECRAGRWP